MVEFLVNLFTLEDLVFWIRQQPPLGGLLLALLVFFNLGSLAGVLLFLEEER